MSRKEIDAKILRLFERVLIITHNDSASTLPYLVDKLEDEIEGFREILAKEYENEIQN